MSQGWSGMKDNQAPVETMEPVQAGTMEPAQAGTMDTLTLTGTSAPREGEGAGGGAAGGGSDRAMMASSGGVAVAVAVAVWEADSSRLKRARTQCCSKERVPPHWPHGEVGVVAVAVVVRKQKGMAEEIPEVTHGRGDSARTRAK